MSDVPGAHLSEREREWWWGLKQAARWARPVVFTPGYVVAGLLSLGLLSLLALYGLFAPVMWITIQLKTRLMPCAPRIPWWS
jgi:hypothetical protein